MSRWHQSTSFFFFFISMTDRGRKRQWSCSGMQECPQNRKWPSLRCLTTPSLNQVGSFTRFMAVSMPHTEIFFFQLTYTSVCDAVFCLVWRHSSVCSTLPSRPVCGRHSQIVSCVLPKFPHFFSLRGMFLAHDASDFQHHFFFFFDLFIESLEFSFNRSNKSVSFSCVFVQHRERLSRCNEAMGIQRSASQPRSNKNSSQTRSFWTRGGQTSSLHTRCEIRSLLISHLNEIFSQRHLGSSQSFQREEDAWQNGERVCHSLWTEGRCRCKRLL